MSGPASRDQRIESIFLRAKDLPATQRSGFLAEACEGDEQLRIEVHDLLAVDLASDSFLDQPMELDATIAPAEGSAVSEGSQLSLIHI